MYSIKYEINCIIKYNIEVVEMASQAFNDYLQPYK